ncbi:replication-relaxation family protein [Bradyrhizobium manausense]|uniref:Uncharacterized protein n=1 Tax=Bradyrhizobium manausense TaxID=989370 RepID=A0A0R3DGX6_9BRAD|nr:replication-relaxation family protein [Bradyrhizobium manausense]KRQ09143.1 hypothetical protein AOQ71_21165 [Bradyrhizobium manausense]
MNRPRTKRLPIVLRRLSSRHNQILSALARYRYLDSKHIFALIGCENSNAKSALRRLFDAGLINRLSNNLFRRDRLKDPQVYEISAEGIAYLKSRELLPDRAIWVKSGSRGTPVHNLVVCLALASFEVAVTKAGLRFIPWEAILTRAPSATKQLKAPFRFPVTSGELIPDAICSVEYPNEYRMFFWEIDLSNHGEKEYATKARGYHELIFKGVYKRHLGVQQLMNVLTITTNTARRDTMANLAKDKPFLFKVVPEYGSYEAAPAPAQSILENWHRAIHPPVNLKEI